MDILNVTAEAQGVVDEVACRYAAANPKSSAHLRAAASCLPGGNTRVALHYDPFPLVIDRAQDGYVHDVDGHAYRDFMNDLTAGFYGHSHPAVINALKGALTRGVSYGGPSVHESRLAEAICRRFASIERVRFCNSGTEANLLALQLARAVTGRRKVLAFSGAYHGSVVSFLPGATALNVESDKMLMAEFNDIAGATKAVYQNGSELAAIIVEPMMGSAGAILAERDFAQALRRLASEAGALLIFDEVQTARLSYGGLQEALATRPDITTLGKFVGGGLTFGALGGRGDVIDRMDPRRVDRIAHGGTFNNNVLTMVAGYVGLTRVATRAAIEDVNARADRLRADLREAGASTDVPLHIGGHGSIIAIHFQPHPPTAACHCTTSTLCRKLVHLELLLRGIYASRRGTINLSTATTDDDCHAFAEAFSAILTEHARLLRQRA